MNLDRINIALLYILDPGMAKEAYARYTTPRTAPMTPDQIFELVQKARKTSDTLMKGALRSDAYDAEMLNADADLFDELATAIESLQASVANAEARYEAAEARNVFLLTELERIMKEAGK